MATFEEEYKRVESIVHRWVAISLLGKRIEVKRAENFVRQGPNIIVGNHCGAFKDIAVILRIVPRYVYFTANKDIFSREEFDRLISKHLKRHLKDFGPVVNSILRPVKYWFVRFISTNIGKVGTIPVDLLASKREALEVSQEYLKKGRAIIALQGRGRVQPEDPHPYVSPFKKGTSVLAYNLWHENNISVPVTPLAMYGTQSPWLVPAKIGVSVGEPMYIRDYLGRGAEESIGNFKDALEKRVQALFLSLIRA
jgi:1-acyl-sn-glycerol-3-phosphate acyltransferase